jgi:hypothetical protein
MQQWGYAVKGPARTIRRFVVPLAVGVPAWWLGLFIHGAVTGLIFAVVAIVAGAML